MGVDPTSRRDLHSSTTRATSIASSSKSSSSSSSSSYSSSSLASSPPSSKYASASAFIARGAVASDLDGLGVMLSSSFATSSRVILPRGHTQDSTVYRRAEMEQWYTQCTTEVGPRNAGTAAGQRRLVVVCPRDEPQRPVGFAQYEMVEPDMQSGQSDAALPPMPPFPEGGDKEQYYLWKDMIWQTRRAILGHTRHVNIIALVVDRSFRGGAANYARRAISDYLSGEYISWGDPPQYNDAYVKAAPLWERLGMRAVTTPIETGYVYATAARTEPTKEIVLRRGGNPEGVQEGYITIPQVRTSIKARDEAAHEDYLREKGKVRPSRL